MRLDRVAMAEYGVVTQVTGAGVGQLVVRVHSVVLLTCPIIYVSKS